MMQKVLFMMATSFFWFSLYAYVPELSTYAKELGASYEMIGIITGSYGLTQTLLRIPLGIISDRFNKRRLFITMGMFIAVMSSLITFFFPTAFSLLVTRLLAGISASTWVAFTVLFASYYRSEESPKAIGFMNAYNALGQLVAMAIGGVVSLMFGTRYLYLLGAFGGICGLVLSFFITENKAIHRVPLKLKGLFTVTLDGMLGKVSILAILSQFITFATTFGFIPIVAQNLGANRLHLSMMTAINIIPAIWVSSLAATVFVRWWGESRTLVYGFLISAVLCMLAPFVSSLSLLMLVQFFAGVGRSMVFPLLMGLSIRGIEDNKRASAMGFFQAIYGVGMIIGPIILGVLAGQFGLVAGFIITGVIGIGAALLTIKFNLSVNTEFK
ncbi:MAG: transporter [Clostridia bacterium]|jgi:MFS family permease|nr:transporter [Clostridia bacterium]